VPLSAPVSRIMTAAESDTLTAAPVAALASALGLPTVRDAGVTSSRRDVRASLDLRWLLCAGLVSLVASWVLRRWRGLV